MLPRKSGSEITLLSFSASGFKLRYVDSFTLRPLYSFDRRLCEPKTGASAVTEEEMEHLHLVMILNILTQLYLLALFFWRFPLLRLHLHAHPASPQMYSNGFQNVLA
jgi:hypothetical protein